ncbi:class I SAM-dependent methyltransferase [Kribbella sp. NBC_00889]|uniref:class I SAM-dependent methyltransferase n=1 Tax=Kribbella sp. NBC_00889 TaxID=2975974 RepID=UPI0038686C7F
MATRTDRRLIDDPFAEPLVRAVGIDLLTRLATGETPPTSSTSSAPSTSSNSPELSDLRHRARS